MIKLFRELNWRGKLHLIALYTMVGGFSASMACVLLGKPVWGAKALIIAFIALFVWAADNKITGNPDVFLKKKKKR